jgi:hypothetical protein
MFFGLIFRASAKSKRAILSWREEKKSVLPQSDASTLASGKLGYGFGRQSDKKGTFKHLNALKRYSEC